MLKKALVSALLLCALPCYAGLNVFACEPEWASLAETLGGDKVQVFSATTAQQDPHFIQARPSLMGRIRKADLLVCTGSELEIGWLPLLLRRSAKSQLSAGSVGHFMAAELIENKLEQTDNLDRSMGDIHQGGNPHVHLNPNNLLIIAEQLSKRLMLIDAGNSEYYQARYDAFSQNLKRNMQQWQVQAKSLQGKQAIVYHKSFSYLLDWLGIETLADLEPKPGIPPNARHLASVLSANEATPADWLIYAPYQSEKPVRWLTKKTAIKSVKLPYTVGGSEKSVDLISLIQEHIDLLLGSVQ